MSVELRRNTFAVAEGSTWGTSAAFGALSGMYANNPSGFNRSVDEIPNNAAGFGLEQSSELGNDNAVAPAYMLWAYEAGYTELLHLAMMFGNDVVTGAGDPYTHTMTMQEVSNRYVSIGYEIGSRIEVVPSAALTQMTVAPSDAGILEFNMTMRADTISIAGASTLSSVTYATQVSPFKMRNMTFRINDQSGGALSASDNVEISSMTLTMNRPSDEVVVSGGGKITQPAEGDYPEWTLEVTIPRVNTDAEGLYDDRFTPTPKKAEIIFAGTTASRELKFIFPQLKIQTPDRAMDSVISSTFMFRCQVASAAPTGMTATAPTATWKTSHATSVLA